MLVAISGWDAKVESLDLYIHRVIGPIGDCGSYKSVHMLRFPGVVQVSGGPGPKCEVSLRRSVTPVCLVTVADVRTYYIRALLSSFGGVSQGWL